MDDTEDVSLNFGDEEEAGRNKTVRYVLRTEEFNFKVGLE